jgi:hypothetical protein
LSGTLFSSLHFQRLFLATIMTTTSNDLLTALIPTIPPFLLFSTTIHGSRCLLHNTTVYIITRTLIHTWKHDKRSSGGPTHLRKRSDAHLSFWLVTSSKPSVVAGGFVPAASTRQTRRVPTEHSRPGRARLSVAAVGNNPGNGLSHVASSAEDANCLPTARVGDQKRTLFDRAPRQKWF